MKFVFACLVHSALKLDGDQAMMLHLSRLCPCKVDAGSTHLLAPLMFPQENG